MTNNLWHQKESNNQSPDEQEVGKKGGKHVLNSNVSNVRNSKDPDTRCKLKNVV